MTSLIDEEIASNPRLVGVAEVLAHYGESRVDDDRNGPTIGIHIEHLLKFWGDKVLADVKTSSCAAYVKWRCAQTWTAPGAKSGRNISDQTAARELTDLSAAIRFWHKEHMLTSVPVVSKPPIRLPAADWLTETEFQRLIMVARGNRWVASSVETREPIWQLSARPQEHLERFISIGFYQGSRHGGILRQRWTRSANHGFFDMETRTCYRSGPEERQTNKRETWCRIHDRLFPKLEEWKKSDRAKNIDFVIHQNGKPILRIHQAFATAVKYAYLDRRDIDGSPREKTPTPHILRHSRATLMLRAGVSTSEVSRFLGMSEKMVEERYGHTHVEYQRAAARS